jgi:hypothetical protein
MREYITSSCTKIMQHHRVQAQKLKLVEELAELIQAVLKSPESLITDDMVEKIADVEIMLTQIESVMSCDQRQLQHDMTCYKLRRQLDRIEDEDELHEDPLLTRKQDVDAIDKIMTVAGNRDLKIWD